MIECGETRIAAGPTGRIPGNGAANNPARGERAGFQFYAPTAKSLAFRRSTVSVSLGHRRFLLRDDGALRCHFCIQRSVVGPLRWQIVFVEDRRYRTFGNAGFAVDTFLRMDKQNGFTFVEAFDRTNNNAVRVFTVEARFSNNMSHGTNLSGQMIWRSIIQNRK